MHWNMATLIRDRRVASFDVICAGEARWDLAARGSVLGAGLGALRFRPGGAAVSVAVGLAARGLRVGLAASLGDDSAGRALLGRLAAAGVDVGGVSLAPARAGIIFVDGMGATAKVISSAREEPPIEIPAGWAAQVLLLTGVSPVVSHAAAFCREARAARRAGALVMMDVNARPHLWMGQEPRMIRSVLLEADVVRCSTEDLAVLGMDAAAVRATMRPNSVLVETGAALVRATGPFGDIAMERRLSAAPPAPGAGDGFTAALCAGLARSGPPGLERIQLWDRLLKRLVERASPDVARPW